MLVHVGSRNATKIASVVETIKDYSMFAGAEVVGLDVPIETFGHPKNIAEIVGGAKARATTAFQNCDWSFGLESGLLAVPESTTGYMEVCVCAIFDGTSYYLGLSPGFEWPKKALELILAGRDGSQAVREIGLTDHEKLGTVNGAVGILTKNRMNRTAQNSAAVMMALVQLENKEYYV